MSQPLLDALKRKTSQHTQSDKDWVQFIHDHRAFILDRSDKYSLDINKLQRYRFRPNTLIGDFGIANTNVWIVLYINNIPFGAGIPFYVDSLWVPPTSVLTDLRAKFVTHQSLL